MTTDALFLPELNVPCHYKNTSLFHIWAAGVLKEAKFLGKLSATRELSEVCFLSEVANG